MTICWFGIYCPNFGRNKIYIQGLRKLGHSVIECHDDSPGIVKFFRLILKHNQIRNKYDAMVVGYPGHLVVPLAKIISRKKVIFDALGSLYDAEINSHSPNFYRRLKTRLIDYFALKFCDIILLESKEQLRFFEHKFGKSNKYKVVYTGAQEMFMVKPTQDSKVLKIIFRGKLTPESGIRHILRAAYLLKDKDNIRFQILGSGYLLKYTQGYIADKNLLNVEFLSQYLPDRELVEIMRKSTLMLGQFENNERLDRTIPHKAFEAFAMGISYLTGDAPAIREIAQNNLNVFFVPLGDPTALAKRIKDLASQPALIRRVAFGGHRLFEDRFSPEAVAESLLSVIV